MYCKKCGVKVRGTSICPLCAGKLEGEVSEYIFPDINTHKKEKMFLKLLILVMLVVSVVCVAVNYSFPSSGYWSLFIVGGFLSFCASFFLVLRKRNNIYKTILWQVVILSIIAVVWDTITGMRGWSTDFVIPIFGTAAMIAMAIIAQITRLEIQDYIVYLVIDSIFALVSLILLLLDITRIILPSLICIGGSIVSLGTLVIFEGRALAAEIRRRLHL